MLKKATVLSALASLLIAGCGNGGDEYLGTWSNQWAGGGLQMTIERNGEGFILTQTIASNGRVVARNSAKYENGNLSVEGNALFPKFAYSKKDDAIAPLDAPLPLPAFKRIN